LGIQELQLEKVDQLLPLGEVLVDGLQNLAGWETMHLVFEQPFERFERRLVARLSFEDRPIELNRSFNAEEVHLVQLAESVFDLVAFLIAFDKVQLPLKDFG